MELIIIIILTIALGISLYAIKNLLSKTENLEESNLAYQEFFIKLQTEVENSEKTLNQIDQRGSFSSDDEIGFIFKKIREINTNLKEYFQE